MPEDTAEEDVRLMKWHSYDGKLEPIDFAGDMLISAHFLPNQIRTARCSVRRIFMCASWMAGQCQLGYANTDLVLETREPGEDRPLPFC